MISSSEPEHPPVRTIDQRLRVGMLVLVTLQIYGIFFSIALSSIAFALASAVFVLMLFRNGKETFFRNELDWYFVAYTAALLLMVAGAMYPWASLYHTRRVLLIALVYLLPVALISPKMFRLFILGLAIIVGLQSCGDFVSYVLQSRARLGFFQHYMTSAGMKMMIILLIVPMMFSSGFDRKSRIICGISVGLTLAALVLTQTRSSWLGLLAGLVIIGILKHRSVLAGIVVVVAAFLLFAPSTIMERARHMFTVSSAGRSTPTIESNDSRMRMWETGWIMFLQRPITGMGEGEMWTIYRTFVHNPPDDEGGHLHNNYVHALASGGIIGFGGLVALFFGILRFEWRAFKRGGHGLTGSVALGALAVFIGLAVNGLAEYNFGDHEILVILWTTVGLVVAASRIDGAAVVERQT